MSDPLKLFDNAFALENRIDRPSDRAWLQLVIYAIRVIHSV